MSKPTPYEKRVEELETEGMTTSDAQGVADVEFMRNAAPELLEALKAILACERDGFGLWDRSRGGNAWTSEELETAIDRAHGAIAKAEGRS